MSTSSQCPPWCELPTPHANTHEAVWAREAGVTVTLQRLDGVKTLVKISTVRPDGRTDWFYPPTSQLPQLATLAELWMCNRIADALRRCHRIIEADEAAREQARGGERR